MFWNRRQKDLMEKTFYALGTLSSIRVFGNIHEAVIDKAIDRVMEIDRRMSAYRDDSEIALLNQNAGNGYVPLSKDTLSLLQLSTEISQQSDGAFDITVHPLVKLWGIGKKGDYIPEPQDILAAKHLVDYRDLLLDGNNHTASLKKRGQCVDLGGIAKGYAADEVKRILLAVGIQSAMINLGGNIAAIGSQPDNGHWRIGLQNPLEDRGISFGTLEVTDKTIVTSGINEQFFIKGSRRYHHIMDPRTGTPAQSALLSVTVISDQSAYADALSTAAFVLGMEKGSALLEQYGIDGVFVTDTAEVFTTRGLAGKLLLLPQKRA